MFLYYKITCCSIIGGSNKAYTMPPGRRSNVPSVSSYPRTHSQYEGFESMHGKFCPEQQEIKTNLYSNQSVPQ